MLTPSRKQGPRRHVAEPTAGLDSLSLSGGDGILAQLPPRGPRKGTALLEPDPQGVPGFAQDVLRVVSQQVARLHLLDHPHEDLTQAPAAVRVEEASTGVLGQQFERVVNRPLGQPVRARDAVFPCPPFPWAFRGGRSVVFPWTFRRPSVDFPSTFRGPSVVFPWLSVALSVALSVVFPWYFRGNYCVFL